MPFIRPELDTIIARTQADLNSRLTGNKPLLRRAFLFIISRVLSGLAHALYGFIDYVSRMRFVTLAEKVWLVQHGIEWGVNQLPSSVATDGTLRFSGTNTTNVPSGTKVVRDDGVEYETTAGGNISSGTVTLAAKCNTLGATGNFPVGNDTLVLVSPITNVDSTVDVIAAFTNGQDEEDIELWRARILARIKNPPAGGSVADYISWALSRAGIFKAFVFAGNDYQGLGTVGVVIVGFDPSFITSGGIITDVQNYIDTVRPVTAAVTVLTVTAGTIDLTIKIKPNNSTIQAAITSDIKQMFKDEGRPRGKILFSHLNEAILNSGLEDYQITVIKLNTVSQPIADVVLTGYQYPILGTITWQDL